MDLEGLGEIERKQHFGLHGLDCIHLGRQASVSCSTDFAVLLVLLRYVKLDSKVVRLHSYPGTERGEAHAEKNTDGNAR